MKTPLQILIAEDNPADVLLLVRALRQAGFEFTHQVVATEAEYLSHLRPDLDIILSDYAMPQFGGLRALELLRERGWETPFIIISGTIGEDLAVSVMKQGATDYLLKDQMGRLGLAITQAIEQGRTRKERRKAEVALRESEERFRQLAENIQEVFWLTDIGKNEILYVSPAYERIWGRTCADLYRSPRSWLDAIHEDDRATVLQSAISKQTEGIYDEEYRIVRPDGSIRWIRDRAFPVVSATGEVDRVAGVARDITEQKEAEAALKLFRNLVDQSDDTFEVIDPVTGRFLDVNEKGCTALGYSRAEHLALRVCDIDPQVGESDWPRVAQEIRAAGFLSREGLHRLKDGSTLPVELNAKWVRLDRDYIIAAVRDISERRQAEKVLKESERRFREMLENVEMIALTLDKKGAVTFCNDYLLKVTGWRREEAIGADWFTKFIPASPELKELFFSTLEAGTVPPHHENSIVTRDGAIREIVWNNTMLRDGTGNIIGTASLGEDVTERNRAEARIREQAAMLDRARDAIIVRGFEDRRITFWSRGAERLYGWTVAEAMGRDVGELICVDPKVPDQVRDALLTSDEWRGDVCHLTRDGEKLLVNCRGTLVRDDAGAPHSVLTINTDITEQKELEGRLLRAQRMESIGTLASGLAHDLNNILAPIMMSVPILRRKLTDEQRETIVTTIEMSAERGTQIVKQVLTFGRGLEGERRPLQVTALIGELVKIMRETFPRNITIKNANGPKVWPLLGDATQIHQVLLNLCVNARDAMPEGGELRVGARNLELDASYASMLPEAAPGPHVLLEVSDTGTGMPPEVVERIFDPFYTTKAIGKGTGLGLSTTLGIVKSHGGFLHVNSLPGKGTTFQVYLPAAPDHEAAAADPAPASVPEGHGELILVVDDEESIRSAVRLALETRGYQALIATDGIEALGLFATNTGRIAMVLTDLMMPSMDGVTLIRALRAMAPGVPIVASTGLGEKAQLSQLAQLGVATVLHKPFGAETLLRTIHDALHAAGNSPSL